MLQTEETKAFYDYEAEQDYLTWLDMQAFIQMQDVQS